MPTTPTYSPVPHAPATAGTQSAPAWRYAQYAEPHPVQPLKGLPGTRATDVSYRALAPGGAGFCYRICTGTSESRPTAHYSLLTANSTYTFSAKEKDSETNLSYFGSRYYNSDLSVWLSVDPMASKYPSLSPYSYCADNPVRMVDPNGEEIDDDIVFHGKNNSSITIKTSLIDLEVNANVDFGGDFTLNLENVAIGFQTEFVATGQAGIGTSYSGFKSKIMFLGGDYAGYWYDYIGGEMQVLAGVSVEASVGIQTSVVLGFYSGDKKGNTPESFAGAYTGVSCSAGLKAALFGVNLSASNVKSMDNRWTIYTFGVSITQGYQEGLGPTVGSGFGHARLTTTSVPTKQRTIGDRIKNLLSH